MSSARCCGNPSLPSITTVFCTAQLVVIMCATSMQTACRPSDAEHVCHLLCCDKLGVSRIEINNRLRLSHAQRRKLVLKTSILEALLLKFSCNTRCCCNCNCCFMHAYITIETSTLQHTGCIIDILWCGDLPER